MIKREHFLNLLRYPEKMALTQENFHIVKILGKFVDTNLETF
jgi:hypothetical protein